MVLGQPIGHLQELLSQAIDRLLVHICLSNKLGKGDC
jgi:hypothetical protein